MKNIKGQRIDVMTKYVLNELGEPIPATSLYQWAAFMEDGKNRVLAKTSLGDDCTVSTVFLGLNHAFEEGADPILWETMVFGGVLAEAMDRCGGSREQAEAMHCRMVRKVTETLVNK